MNKTRLRISALFRKSSLIYHSPESPRTKPKSDYEILHQKHGVELKNILPDYAKNNIFNEIYSWWKSKDIILEAQKRVDVLLFLSEDVGFFGSLLLTLFGAGNPILIIYHGHATQSKKNILLRSFLSRIKTVHWLPLSQALADDLTTRGVRSERIHNIGYGADADFFSITATDSQGIAVCSAGLAHRDYLTLVQACAEIDGLVRIAADSLWFKVDTNISGLALSPKFDVRSAGDMSGLRDIYSRSAVVVVPMENVDHACGYAVIYEAMAMGRPVIATRTRAPSDAIRHGETGLLVPPHDVNAMRTAIRQLLDSPENAIALGKAAQAYIRTNNSMEDFADRIIAAAEKAIATG